MGQFTTVGELKKLLEKYDDKTPIFSYKENMERSGFDDKNFLSDNLRHFAKITKQTWDRFDGEDYSYDTFEKDPEGDYCGIILN